MGTHLFAFVLLNRRLPLSVWIFLILLMFGEYLNVLQSPMLFIICCAGYLWDITAKTMPPAPPKGEKNSEELKLLLLG